jgi:LPPG:FO 2-phospho-L-lactate transferase
VLPMTDREVRTKLTLVDGDEIDFQEYFVRRGHAVAVAAVRFEGAESATPAPGVREALDAAELIVIAPSNPIVSIGPILAVPGIREVLRARRAGVVAVSPIIGGRALKGPADRLLGELGAEVSALGIAAQFREIAGSIVIDVVDAVLAPAIAALDVTPVVTETIMRTPEISAKLATAVLEAGRRGVRA